ncbi:early endosome antigen 1 isoform X2 [Drosophila teissieri]|uniref:early endosome antigen 1 isoform X2 n=1 Tax=Drosophila teissieri TaxID=7243 RepID=UPI001CBA35A1|nr:early endosome antigen 1 isoform X2 [Drosophila teissieri]
MDMRSWRKVLLQWIGECQFIEPNYISLEQSDIESFYSIFIQKIQETETVTEEGKTALQAQPKEYRPMLQEFLSQNYTEFNTHLDDSGDLLSSDYLYVYTLLLQYSCVKKPSVFFHSICNKLPELTQTCIASFLGETVDRLLTRQYLRQSIANVAAIYRQGASASVSPCNPSTMRSPDPRGDDAPCSSSSSSSQPSSSTPQLHKHREHLRLQISASEMPPPPTPKTELLEQRTKELRALRSQLEMVRYEKTVLEEQQLEKDDLIKDLNREKMIAKIELEKLKNAKLAEEQHDDEDYVRPHEYEHMKSTLLKEIGQKEDVITEISDKLHDLRAEKSGLSERLNATGERLLEYADRIRVLESRVDDLTRMLSSRDERISSLELDKQELDQCLQEAREELHNRREVLNSSSDLLNCSLSPNTTPENLASSVIDKQLREKEHENAELKEELQKRNNSQLELCQALSSFLQKHNIDHESPVEWTSSSLLSSIAAIESNFAETVNKSAQMKEDCYVHAAHIEKLLGKCVLLSGTVESQEKELEEAKAAMVELMDSALESSREYSSMQRSFDMKIADVTSKSKEQQLDNERLNEKCAELNSMVAIGDEHLANINLQLREKEEQMKVVGAEIRDLRAKNLLLENMLSDIADKGTSEAIHTQNLQHNNKFVRSKYDVCRRELIAQNSFQDELARMLNVPDWETMNCRIAQLIEMQAEHDELNLVYARKEKQLEELSAQHDKLMQTHLELGKKKEIELKEKKAQLEEFEEHNKNLDRFLVRIRTLLGGSKRRRSSLNSSATSVESVQIEKRFEEIATLIERQLQSADALKEEISELQAKNDEVVLNYINGVKKRERIINSLEDKSEKLRSTLTALEKEICSNNKKIAELEETLSKERSNAEEVAQRLDTAQQEIEGYHVEATRFMTTISERLQQDFDGTNNTPQQLGTCMSKFLEMYDQMEARYQESSSSVEQLTQSKAQLEQQVDELQKEVASQQAINKESSSSVEQLTQSKAQLEQQVAALQKEVASQEVTNLRSGPLIKQLNDTIQNLERVNAKLSEDNSASHTARLDMSDSLLRTHNELERRINRVVHLEATERRMTTELSDCKREMNELKKELKSSEEKFAQMKQMYEAQLEALEVICDKETEEKEDLQINLRETEDVYLKSEEKYKKLVKTTEDAHEKELKSSEEKFAQMKEMYEAQLEALEVICDKETEEKEDLQISLRETEDVYLKSEEKYKKLVMTSEDAHEKLCKEHEKRCGDLQKLCDELEEQLAQKELTDSSELLITQAELQKEKELTADLKEQLDKNEEIKSLQESQLQEQELVDQLKADFDMKQMELSKVRNELESCLLISTELEEAQVKAKEELLCLQIKLEEERNLVGSLKVELEKKQADLDGLKTALETQTKISDTREGQEKAALREVFLAKERLVKAEREFEVNLATLEDQIETLEERHIQTEAERANAYERINMLEARCLEKDDTIRTLQGQIVRVEHLQHQLQSEMGSHNSVVEQLNRELAEKASELLDVQNRLEIEIAERNQANEQLAHISNRPEVIELQHRLEAETAERIEAEKKLAEVTDRLDEVVQELDGTRLEHGAQKLKLEERAREAEQNHDELTERLGYYKERLDSLERHLAACNEELADLQSGRAKLTEATPDLGATYSTADEQHLESDQKARNNKLVLDCQILQAKYRDAKDEIQRGEQKIKDQRLEMEGKLDKMKNKMRSLYTAEVTRMKEKQERDASKSAAELEALTAQNAKYEEHTRKLSNQIVRLNEKILEQQKQHAITSTKLRHLQMQPISETKPSAATPLTVSSSSSAANDDWQPFKRPNVPSSNLAMEDEEGEVFNNTYLTDLKLGRVPADMTAEELIYRNSLQPPHLKSTYAAQYDLCSQDEDLKDGPHSLDDSMSALLSSSSTGARKKSMGTHYKRPGPPTPSKNGGRLSFGSSEPPREILREFGDHNNTSKTPARFKFLTQRFSVGSSGLPRDELPRRKRPNLLTGIHRRKLRQAVDFFCTSTPRKSRSYYDQQRLIRASDADKSKADETEEEVLQVDAEGVPELEPHEDADQQGTPHLSTAALLALTKGNTRRLTGPAKPKKGRVSLSLHGNIFAKSRPAAFVAGKRVQLRRKLRRERMGRFDEARHLDQVRLSYSAQTPTSAENNNYSLHNRNEEHLPSQILMGKTMVLEGKRRLSPVVSTTFNVAEHSRTSQLQQQFEHENCATWAVLDGESVLEETQDDWHFEQLCRETESTAPFQLQPLDYKPIEEPVEPKFPQLVASCSNITANSCATNMTSASSCTLYSMGSVHMQPLPSVNITYVQSRPDTQLRRPTRHRSLMTHCRQFLRHLSLGERLIVGFALLVMVGLASQLADKLVLAITGVLAGMGLVLLTYSCNGLNQKRKPKQWESHKSYY